MNKNAKIITIADTKGGSTKSTTAVNLAAFCAHSGLKTLLLDFDLDQPAVSSYFPLIKEAESGVYEFLIFQETDANKIISQTIISNLDVMVSNSSRQEINAHLSASADGTIRLKSCLKSMKPSYDVIIIDTVGTVDPTVSMAVLSSDVVLSPLEPSMPGVREYLRGTVSTLFKSLIPFTEYGIVLPDVYTFFNRIEENNDCKRIKEMFNRQIANFQSLPINFNVLNKDIKKQNSYKVAASLGIVAFESYAEIDKNTELPYRITKKQAALIKEDICYLSKKVLPEFSDKFDSFMFENIN